MKYWRYYCPNCRQKIFARLDPIPQGDRITCHWCKWEGVIEETTLEEFDVQYGNNDWDDRFGAFRFDGWD